MSQTREREFLLFGLDPIEYSLKGLAYLAVLFLGAIVVASVLCPFVYWGVAFFGGTSTADYILEKGLPKIFDRLRWIPVLLLFPWVLKRCGLLAFSNLGLVFNRSLFRPVGQYFGLGVLMLVLAACIQFFGAELRLRDDYDISAFVFVFFETACLAAVSCVLIGIVEEIVFRGMVFRMFYTAVSPRIALLLSALFFAFVHFKKVPSSIWERGEELVHVWSGFYIGLWTVFSIFVTFDPIRFLNLFVVGLILTYLFWKKKSLWPSVGLHAGWVWVVAVYKEFVDVKPAGMPLWVFGSEGLLDGFLAFVILSSFGAGIYWRLERDERRIEIAGNT